MVPSTETHVPEGSVDPEKGGAALPAPQAEVKTIFTTGATETAEIKTPDGELKLWRNKAVKALSNGRSAAVKFETEAIDEELAEEIRGALEMADVRADVKAIFDTAGGQLAGGAALAVRSWRPWSEYEQRLMTTLQGGLRDQAKRIIEEMRQTDPQAMLMDDELWGRFERDLLHDMEGDLTQLARSTVSRVQLAQGPVAPGMEINWGLANQNAVDWARSDAASKVRKINETTRQAIRDEVSDWSKQGGTLDDLTARIEGMTDGSGNPVFDRRRAQLIASTEATDTYAEANNQAWQAAGYAPAAFRPAAHPGCRCYLRPMTLKDGTKVMVWNTARDELVCKKPITTPWGQVEGCGALNGVCVSEGPHMGEKVA
jgi:hypothetical protein